MKEYMQSGHTNMTFTVMQHSRPVSCYEKLVQLKLLTCTNNEENKKISNRGRVYTEVWNTTFRKWKPQQKAVQSIYRLHLLILLLWSIISRYRIVDFFFLLKATQLISVQHIKQIYPTLILLVCLHINIWIPWNLLKQTNMMGLYLWLQLSEHAKPLFRCQQCVARHMIKAEFVHICGNKPVFLSCIWAFRIDWPTIPVTLTRSPAALQTSHRIRDTKGASWSGLCFPRLQRIYNIYVQNANYK